MGDSSEIDSTLLTTDQSVTFSHILDSSQNQTTSRTLDVTRDELERRQLAHTIQLLKLEVSQKQLLLETVRSETGGQLEELREQLADTQHTKKLVSLRLQSMTQAYEQEVKVLKERNKQLREELESQTRRSLKDESVVFSHLGEEVEQVLTSPHLSVEEYQRLASMATLPTPDLIRLRIHELTGSLERRCDDLEKQLSSLNEELQTQCKALQLSQQKETEYKEQANSYKESTSRLKLELSEVKVQIQEGNYKIDNFDSIKRERDVLKREMDRLKLKLQEAEIRDGNTKEEMNRLTTELSRSQQTESLHQQDKEYLGRQVSALTLRASEAEERAGSSAIELEQARRDRENVYQQLMKSRDEQRVDYESRMQRELEALRARTALEIDQMRSQSTEIMERDRCSLTEARNLAIAERDSAQTRERETNVKYQQLLKEHHELQAASEGRVSELQAKLQVAQFERERVTMVTEDATKQLNTLQLEKEKLHKKVDLLSQELWRCQSENESERRGLEVRVEEQRLRLEGYERVERDLDDLVLQAAQSESESDAERVLFSYGFGASLPTTSKRRLQQSVQLARRVLQLEKINTSLRIEQESKQEAVTKLRKQVESLESLLEQSKQPYSYLIETIRSKDSQLERTTVELDSLKKEVKSLKVEREKLVLIKNQMALDLEKLLRHNEELQRIKQMLYNVRPHPAPQAMGPKPPLVDNTCEDNYPLPTLFTKPKAKSRLKKLS